MHCPRCGQQQVSTETKFCSRCGFQLGLVAELLANGGVLPQLAELYKGKGTIFTRKNGVIFTILWFIFFVMMIPAFLGLANAEDAAGVSAVFGVFTTIMLLIVSLGFLKKTPKGYPLKAMEAPAMAASLHVQPNAGALPPQQQQPAGVYSAPQGGWRTPDTGELVERGSVIENTTKLLKQDEK
jgi:hypothetical protein